ncbi:hypothetical protein M427DRAFT_52951 [Gonapodya prolifera JEL478]|uniref:DUF654-domain-containing protein n=1 Tax=Gonapodya prolifera (strain JEL478) TaxID=1344416 RepID=A0A139AS26_GONPJ|nr:hypothetical protein M427DRAFT_52951 [Gonapodya prolifera JEL478]|eukprot:KXS19540.1 hypothetical protein M427DRAFT_52951 [Gonapodya prolifera JEL478]
MSRQVRKLIQQRERERIDAAAAEENESEIEGTSERASNLFDLLAGGEDVDEPTSSNEAETGDPVAEEYRASPVSNRQAPHKKKKKKGKGKALQNTEKANGATSTGKEESEDEIERAVREIQSRLGATKQQPVEVRTVGPSVFPRWRSLLSANPKYLDPDADLKRLLGADFHDDANRRRPRGAPGGRDGGVRMKKTVLVRLNEEWPRVEKIGLEMELIRSAGDVNVFGYTHSGRYMEIERAFLTAVYSFDPNPLAQIARRHPYHVSTLLALSEVYRHSGDHQTAIELLDRSLYALEVAFHPRFTPFTLSSQNKAVPVTGTSSVACSILPYSNPLNRTFHIALCKHAQALSRGSRHRSALETVKVMLSTSLVSGSAGGAMPDQPFAEKWGDDGWDPLGMFNFLDVLALKAGEAAWFGDLCVELEIIATQWATANAEGTQGDWTEVERSIARTADILRTLPNILIGKAAAEYRLEEENGNGHVGSTKMLVDALKQFPMVIPLLYDKLDIHDEEPGVAMIREAMAGIDGRDATSVAARTLRYCKAYATMSHSIWSPPAQLSFLRTTVSEFLSHNTSIRSDLFVSRGMGLLEPSSFHRFLFLTDDPTLQALIPEQLLERGMLLHDPLPPRGIQSPYEEFLTSNGFRNAPGNWDDGEDSWEQEENVPNPLPNEDTPPGAATVGTENGDQARDGTLRSLPNLLRWMLGGGDGGPARELLQSLNLWGRGADGEMQEEEEDEESDQYHSFDDEGESQ